jgi:hypothetical protein
VKPWLAAASVSGLPSTAYSLAAGRDPLEATKAAGTLVLGEGAPPLALVAAALPTHLALSFAWAAVLERTLPRRRRVLWGSVAGLAIAALDLAVIGRRYPAIRRLALVPQLADHVLYGVSVALVLDRRR